MSPHRALAILAIALTGCLDDDPLDLAVRVTIPAEVSSIPVGTLHLRVWTYDPYVLDGPANLTDHVIARFEHRTGRRTELVLRSSSRVPRGHEHYITIEGCERTIEGDLMVLGDGFDGVSRPRVTMEPIHAFRPCFSVSH